MSGEISYNAAKSKTSASKLPNFSLNLPQEVFDSSQHWDRCQPVEKSQIFGEEGKTDF